jgi:alpha-amylase
MVRFRNSVGDERVTNWWDNGRNQIAFSRGNRGFIAINNDDHLLSARLQTGLSQGMYCDVISGNIENGQCTGKVVVVDSSGNADIQVPHDVDDPMLAIHWSAKL